MTTPTVLVLDIETSKMVAGIWQLKDQYIRYQQLKKDWHLMAWGAKWLRAPVKDFLYEDQRKASDITNDKAMLEVLWKHIDKADFIITQNGVKFDWPRLKARFMLNGLPPPSHFEHIDIYKELKGVGFTSHSLDYLTNKFCKKYKKLSHSKFPGESLWDECEAGNKEAWDEMEKYNRNDVLSSEELFLNTLAWMPKVQYKITNPVTYCAKCGGKSFTTEGVRVTKEGSYVRKYCRACGELRKA